MTLRLLLVAATLALPACTTDAKENPQVVAEPTTRCGPAARLVTDACTRLGSDDGCVEVKDVCIALCDGRQTCTTVGDLRVLNPWATAPDGYCVECTTP